MKLHELLQLERTLIVFDTETTGTNTNTDRIIEFGYQVWTPELGLAWEWSSLINPGMHIHEDASKVHGIFDEMMLNCRVCGKPPQTLIGDGCCTCDYFRPIPTFKYIAPVIAATFNNCDFAGKNIRFDIRITSAECKREGVVWSPKDARIVDIERIEALANPRTLSALHKKYTGAPHEDAHGVQSDVRASVIVLERQFETYPLIPRTLDALHELQFPGMIDLEGKFKFVNGVPSFGGWGKYANRPMHTVPKDYYDFILQADFSPEVKDIARQAKLGQYPQQGKSQC